MRGWGFAGGFAVFMMVVVGFGILCVHDGKYLRAYLHNNGEPLAFDLQVQLKWHAVAGTYALSVYVAYSMITMLATIVYARVSFEPMEERWRQTNLTAGLHLLCNLVALLVAIVGVWPMYAPFMPPLIFAIILSMFCDVMESRNVRKERKENS